VSSGQVGEIRSCSRGDGEKRRKGGQGEHIVEVIKMSTETQQSELVLINQISKEKLAKVVSELIRENEEVRMVIINLACASPYIKTQI